MKTLSLVWLEWFDEEEREEANKMFGTMKNLLVRNKLLSIVVRKWLRERLGKNIQLDESTKETLSTKMLDWIREANGKNERLDINKAEDQDKIIETNYSDRDQIRKYAENELKAMIWAEAQWGDLVPQIFLDEKEKYNAAIIKTVSVSFEDKEMANEIYCGVNEGEYDIEEADKIFAKKVKCTKGGGVYVRMNEVKPQMRAYINQSTVGKISNPIRVENRIAIIEVKEYQEKKLDKSVEEQIIKETLDKFLEYGVGEICDYLITKDTE